MPSAAVVVVVVHRGQFIDRRAGGAASAPAACEGEEKVVAQENALCSRGSFVAERKPGESLPLGTAEPGLRGAVGPPATLAAAAAASS